jgi:hypothetical protein
MPEEYVYYRIEDTRRLTVEYPELRVPRPFARGSEPIVIPGLIQSATYTYIADDDAQRYNVPRFNREARLHYERSGAEYVDIEYAIESATVRFELVEESGEND